MDGSDWTAFFTGIAQALVQIFRAQVISLLRGVAQHSQDLQPWGGDFKTRFFKLSIL